MTDLHIKITDEDGKLLQHINVYHDGSDSADAGQIAAGILDDYDSAKDVWEERENGAIESLEDFLNRALRFDFYTDMSDDHRVYSSGRRQRELMDAYAAHDKTAGKLWDFVCQENLDGFMVHQLMERVCNVVWADDRPAALQELSDFLIRYLASTGAQSYIGKYVRGRIADLIDAPPSYKRSEREARNKAIDDYIENYTPRERR